MDDEVKPQSELCRMPSGRWALNEIELTCGSCFQVRIDNHWINVRIEHDADGYYAIPYSVRLLKGMTARFLGEWAD